jgi:hypothetical protein
MFAQLRGSGDDRGDSNIANLLRNSEKQIHDLQRETGFDWYWRIYFALS